MRAINKHLVRFEPKAVDCFDNVGQSGIKAVTNWHPAEYSPEIAYIVDSPNPFFISGDMAIVSYDVFIRGKYPELNNNVPEPTRIVYDDVYYAFDHELRGKIVDGKIIPAPGFIFIEGPKESRSGLIKLNTIFGYREETERQRRINAAFWAKGVAGCEGWVFCQRASYMPYILMVDSACNVIWPWEILTRDQLDEMGAVEVHAIGIDNILAASIIEPANLTTADIPSIISAEVLN